MNINLASLTGPAIGAGVAILAMWVSDRRQVFLARAQQPVHDSEVRMHDSQTILNSVTTLSGANTEMRAEIGQLTDKVDRLTNSLDQCHKEHQALLVVLKQNGLKIPPAVTKKPRVRAGKATA